MVSHPSYVGPTDADVELPDLGRMFATAPVPTRVTVALDAAAGGSEPPHVTLVVETPVGVFAVPLTPDDAVSVGGTLRSAGMRARRGVLFGPNRRTIDGGDRRRST